MFKLLVQVGIGPSCSDDSPRPARRRPHAAVRPCDLDSARPVAGPGSHDHGVTATVTLTQGAHWHRHSA